MAKETPQRNQGRIKQMLEVYRTTKQHDRSLPWTMLLVFLAPIVVAVLLAAFLPGSGVVSWILWPITGILIGILAAMAVLGRRAERMAYQQIEGRPGAVGAVLASGLRKSYRGFETPIAISPRSKDAVYCAIGRGGIVLVGEGGHGRLKRMLADEERKMRRIFPQVPVTHFYVGRDSEDQVPLPKLPKAIYRVKGNLKRREVQAVYMRLEALSAQPVGIPKGVDPNRVRRAAKPR